MCRSTCRQALEVGGTKMIKNTRGSILVVTLGFVFVFTLLGFGALHYAYTQNERVEREKASAEAFWLADGALQMAYQKLSHSPTNIIAKNAHVPSSTDFRPYDVFSETDSCPPPLCSNEAREQDPAIPQCSDQQRSMDPGLCDPAERAFDPALCDDGTRISVPNCTDDERVLDPSDNILKCPCEISNTCPRLCPCTIANNCNPIGRCLCEYDPNYFGPEGACRGQCPCELTKPPSCQCGTDCECNGVDECLLGEVGRCPCEVAGSCCVSWNIQSYGEVAYACTDPSSASCERQSRAIQAKVSVDYGNRNIENAIETWGDVNKDRDCEPDGNADIQGGCKQQSDFTFESVFGQTREWFWGHKTHYYLNPKNFQGTVEGITFIEMTGKNTVLSINTDTQPVDADGIPIASLLIIDTSGIDPKFRDQVSVNIDGNGAYRGIIWVIGEAKMAGTTKGGIRGAVFVAGDPGNYTSVTGTKDIYWDPYAIREALDTFDGTMGNEIYSDDFKIISWNEIDMNKADY